MKKLAVVVVALLLVSLAFSINWKQFEGTTLRILANRHPWTNLIQEKITEFESLTGMRVIMEIFPEDQFRTKRTVELSSGVGDVDLFMIMPGQSGKQYYLEGWLYPVDDFINDPTLTDPSWDYNDFFAGVLSGGNFEGKQYCIPIQSETSLLAYRKDLFEKYGVKVPTTMEELEEAAKKLTIDEDGDGKADIYGITLRGKGAAATSQFVDFLYTFGGRWMNEKDEWALDEPAAIQAFEFYAKLLREYGPPGGTNIHWYESTSYFMQGKAAMIYDANVFKSLYEDPSKSKVAGKVGYATIPKGPGGYIKPHVSQWALAIYSGSKHPKAAWLFVQWATSKEMVLEGLMRGIPAPRRSAWESEKYKATDKNPDWTKATMESYAVGNPIWNPPVINVPEARDLIGNGIIVPAILGQDVKKAVESTLPQLNALLERERLMY